ncbi:acyltransferase [Duganella rhizosphaerae]|uniref:acyltransferase family protein n=1 Tax=Duganella rhizosphaerae TaxID=2885763 RepID=UPI0030E980C2
MATHEKNLDWVQLLRGIAALLVVLTHARYALLNTPDMPLADRLFVPGAMGVDLFFIISGFIMHYSTTNFDGSAGYVARFAIKRFARVWPMYAAITLLSVFVLNGGIDYFHVAANRLKFWHSLGMIPFNPRYVPYFSLTLLPGWTLEFEMYFYLVFAVSMLFRRLRWFVLGSWVLLTVILMPLGQRGFEMDVTRDLGYQIGYMSIVTSPFVLEFAAGVLIGWLYQQDWARFRSAYVAWHVVGVSVAAALWFSYSFLFSFHGPGKWGLPLMVMVLALALASKTVHLRVPALFLWLGSISYSLYLTHLLSQGLVTRLLITSGHGAWAQTWSYIFISTAVALAFASLSHHYLEQRLSDRVRDGLLKLLPKRPAAPPRAAAEVLARRA